MKKPSKFRMPLKFYSVSELSRDFRDSFSFQGNPYRAPLDSDLVKYFTDQGIWCYQDSLKGNPVYWPLEGRSFHQEKDFVAYHHMVYVEANDITGEVTTAEWLPAIQGGPPPVSAEFGDSLAWAIFNQRVTIAEVANNGIRRYTKANPLPGQVRGGNPLASRVKTKEGDGSGRLITLDPKTWT